jgi:hypothetical protein
MNYIQRMKSLGVKRIPGISCVTIGDEMRKYVVGEGVKPEMKALLRWRH